MRLLLSTLTNLIHQPNHPGATTLPQDGLWCRHKRKRTCWLLLLPAILLLTLVTACQSLPRPAVPHWLPDWWGAAPTATPLPITTTLYFVTWSATPAVEAYYQQTVTAYQQAQPAIQVKLEQLPNYSTRLRTALEGDAPPDLFRLNAFLVPDLAAKGLLVPLPAALLDVAELSPLLRQMAEVDGVPYCLPHDVSTLALLYNRALFDTAQLAYPTGDWTWETLRTTAEQLTDAKAGRYGLVLPADFSRWLPFLYQAGGTVLDSTTLSMTITSPAAVTALQFYSNLVLDGMAAAPPTLGSSWAGAAFAQGQAAMTIEGNWVIPYLTETAPDLAYGVAPLPAGPVTKATVAFANCYAIAAHSTQTAAAVAFLQFLTNADNQLRWQTVTAALPARSSLLDGWRLAYPAQTAFAQGVTNAYPWHFRPGLQPVVDTMNDGLLRIYEGFVLPEAVLAEADAVGTELLARQQAQK